MAGPALAGGTAFPGLFPPDGFAGASSPAHTRARSGRGAAIRGARRRRRRPAFDLVHRACSDVGFCHLGPTHGTGPTQPSFSQCMRVQLPLSSASERKRAQARLLQCSFFQLAHRVPQWAPLHPSAARCQATGAPSGPVALAPCLESKTPCGAPRARSPRKRRRANRGRLHPSVKAEGLPCTRGPWLPGWDPFPPLRQPSVNPRTHPAPSHPLLHLHPCCSR